MIRVTVELISAVHPSRNRLLGRAEIARVGGEVESASYHIKLSKWAPKERETWREATLHRFNSKRFGAWDLLLLGIGCALGPSRVSRLGSAPKPTPLEEDERMNRHGEGVRVNAEGRCTDCGEKPERCSPDHK